MFKERKVAQVAAYLLNKEGGRMPHLKLMKLMYLADRQCLDTYGRTITEDRMVSMPHGPVLSMSLNIMSGNADASPGGWGEFVSPISNNEVCLLIDGNSNFIDQLSRAEIEILEKTYSEFGHMTKWEIRDFSHTLSEWHDPQGSSLPISTEDVLKGLNKSNREIDAISSYIRENKYMDSLLSSL